MKNLLSKNLINRSKVKDNVFIICMLLLPIVHFIVFTIYINFSTIVMSFQNIDYTSNELIWVGFKNYKKFFIEFSESRMWTKAIWNSVLYFPVTNFITLPLSIFAAYFLFRKVPLSNIYRVLFFFPSIISIVILALVFKNMFDPVIGPINMILMKIFKVPADLIPAWLVDPKYAMKTLYLYCVWAGIGYNVVLISGNISRIPTEILESGRMDGITTFKEIFYIVIPLVWPIISTLFVFGAMTVFTQFLHPLILTPSGASETWTIAGIIIGKVKGGSDLYYASSLGILFTLIGVPIVYLVKFLIEKAMDVVEV